LVKCLNKAKIYVTFQGTGKRGVAGRGQVRDWHVLLGQGAPRRERRDVRGHRFRVQNQSELTVTCSPYIIFLITHYNISTMGT